MNRIGSEMIVKPMWGAFNRTTGAIDRILEGKKPWQIVAMHIGTIASLVLLYTIVKKDWKMTVAKAALWLNANKIAQERADLRLKLEEKLFAELEGEICEELPPKGIDAETLIAEMQKADHSHWQNGKATGAVYHNRREIYDVIIETLKIFLPANPLHPDLFPDVRRYEASIIRMTLNMFHGDDKTCGAVSSGGTESILLACLAARNRGKALYGITQPEIIIPSSAHAAFKKAAHCFGIKLVVVPVNPRTFQADVKAMEQAITKNTLMLVGSCPSFPHGTIDDIGQLSEVVEKYNGRIGLHVDCCLGGFLVPFIPNLEPFDFRVKGVTSISADPHKYGYTPKGTSVVMYRNEEWLKYQIFTDPTWSGGVYGTPTLAGSRPGALIAAAWAVMRKMGAEGYAGATAKILGKTWELKEQLLKNKDIEILGNPKVSVIAFTLKDQNLDVYDLKDKLKKRGWHISELQHPPALHFCLTLLHADDDNFTLNFMRDLTECIAELKDEFSKAGPEKKKKAGTAALYGTMHKIPRALGWLSDFVFGLFVQDYFTINYQTKPRVWKKIAAAPVEQQQT